MSRSLPVIAAASLPDDKPHCNRVPFEGCLTLLDVLSDRAPSGARGHRVVLTRAAAEKALPGLIGMAVDYKAGWDGHDARQKCGVIMAAEIRGEQLLVRGFLYGRDFPEVELRCAESPEAMGMSYELADARVEDMRRPEWILTRATFTGAAILLADKAAYRNTSFRICRHDAGPKGESRDQQARESTRNCRQRHSSRHRSPVQLPREGGKGPRIRDQGRAGAARSAEIAGGKGEGGGGGWGERYRRAWAQFAG